MIGASRLGLRCLEKIISLPNCELIGAVTAQETFRISYSPGGVKNVLYADIRQRCAEHAIPVLTIRDGMKDSGLREAVLKWRPDAFLVAGWYHMIPRDWLTRVPAYGLHASLLPDYSGGAPLVWAMINGEKETGITLFKFNEGVDSGPIVGQASTGINIDDTIATLYARIEDLALSLLNRHLPELALGRANLIPQSDTGRRYFPQRKPEDGRVNWSWDASRIYNFVRAQTAPYPGAFTTYRNEKLTLWSTGKPEGQSTPLVPGQIIVERGKVNVGCGSGTALTLGEVSFEERPMRALQWASKAVVDKDAFDD